MTQRDDTPRDLLFGLLALQNGMVTRDQLVLAFGLWTGSPGRPLADLLAEQGAFRPEHRPLIDALVKAHLGLHDGDPVKSLATLDVNGATRASLAEAGGPEVEATLGLVGSGSNGDADRTAAYPSVSAPRDGQRYRVLRPHARGGLGEVFVAEDVELRREVALKQIQRRYVHDSASRSRFLLEAKITGGLEHPGIVPVYGLGSDANGQPYYAMRFIRGSNLRDTIARFHADPALKRDPGARSVELRKLLRRFLDVCDAIEYAHSRGVLHRDLKPGNVIVGKFGETLVADWGLAKVMGQAENPSESTLDPSRSSDAAETLPGKAIGTPAYMSPEQAAGDLKRLGPRSDVYSLGATLYCLLTGKAPFERGGPEEILAAVRRARFPRPRKYDPAIDKGLEAICLKAMANSPEDRYSSARALADDLDRWLADEPVGAYREGPIRKFGRWCRRHPVIASWVMALFFVDAQFLAVLGVDTEMRLDQLRAQNLYNAYVGVIFYLAAWFQLMVMATAFDGILVGSFEAAASGSGLFSCMKRKILLRIRSFIRITLWWTAIWITLVFIAIGLLLLARLLQR